MLRTGDEHFTGRGARDDEAAGKSSANVPEADPVGINADQSEFAKMISPLDQFGDTAAGRRRGSLPLAAELDVPLLVANHRGASPFRNSSGENTPASVMN